MNYKQDTGLQNANRWKEEFSKINIFQSYEKEMEKNIRRKIGKTRTLKKNFRRK